MKFRYESRTKEGEPQVGYVEAANKDAAAAILAGHDLFVLKIEGSETERWYDRVSSYFSGVKRTDMLVFTRQFATLLEARLSIDRALSTLYSQTVNPTLKEAIYQISEDIDSGVAFSQALERQNAVFPPFFVSMVRAAELTGNLNQVMSFLADYSEKENNLATKARSALTYPVVILSLFTIVAFIMVTVVFPQIKPIFEQSGVELPIYTKVLISSGEFLSEWWPGLIVMLGMFIFILLDYFRTIEGKAFRDDMKIKLPLLRKIFVPLTITRFCNASAMLIKGGIPVAQAMEVAAQTIDNVLYQDVLHEVAGGVREGQLLSESLQKHPEYFPSLVGQMLAVGEATGQLEQIFSRIGTFFEREADAVMNTIVDLIQPIMMVVIGGLVGLLFAALLLPLYQLSSAGQ